MVKRVEYVRIHGKSTVRPDLFHGLSTDGEVAPRCGPRVGFRVALGFSRWLPELVVFLGFIGVHSEAFSLQILGGKSMASQDDEAELEELFSRWKGVSDRSAKHSTYANLVLARILGTIRARTNWSAEKLQENLVKLTAESGLSFSRLVDHLGERSVRRSAKELLSFVRPTTYLNSWSVVAVP